MGVASFTALSEAEAYLRREGFEPVNPALLPRSWAPGKGGHYFSRATQAGAGIWPVGGGYWRTGTWPTSAAPSRNMARRIAQAQHTPV